MLRISFFLPFHYLKHAFLFVYTFSFVFREPAQSSNGKSLNVTPRRLLLTLVLNSCVFVDVRVCVQVLLCCPLKSCRKNKNIIRKILNFVLDNRYRSRHRVSFRFRLFVQASFVVFCRRSNRPVSVRYLLDVHPF